VVERVVIGREVRSSIWSWTFTDCSVR